MGRRRRARGRNSHRLIDDGVVEVEKELVEVVDELVDELVLVR